MKDCITNKNITIKTALSQLSKSGKKCLVILDRYNRLLGTLSDGDVRRAILKGNKISDNIKNIYKKKPLFLKKNGFNIKQAREIFIKKNLDLIPIIDEKKKLFDILFLKDFLKEKQKFKYNNNIEVVIMAGGKGSRLEPFTKILPKPLIPINDKPIINHIIESFEDQGINKFITIINYKAKILKAFFKEYEKKLNLKIFEERIPLGTAGGLSILKKKITKSFIMTNCDIICTIDYKDLSNFHHKKNFDITLVASTKNFVIPYGVCQLTKSGVLKKVDEKPQKNLLVSIGLYVIHPRVLNYIPVKKKFDMTDLIQIAKKRKCKIGLYPIDESSWNDIGQWKEYKETAKIL